jgi:general secretion pathway protein D
MMIRPTFLLLSLLLAGCGLQPVSFEGDKLTADDTPEVAIAKLTQAVKDHPNELSYRTALTRTVDLHVAEQLVQGELELRAGKYEAAEARFREALRYHPENPRAKAGLAAIDSTRRHVVLVKDAKAALAKDELETARSLLRAVLAKEPGNVEAQQLLAKVDEKSGRTRGAEFPQLAATFRRPITLQFKDAPLKSMFDAISRQSGLNFIFDKEVNVNQRSTVFAKETALADVLDMLLATSQLAKKVLNANTLLIFPNTPVKQKDYRDMVVKSFFLANASAKETMNLIRSMAKIKDIYIDERLNMVAVRDTAEAVALAEKLVAVTDRPEAEVMLQVEIMEVGGSKLQELGVLWPTQFSVLTPPTETSLYDPDTNTTITTETPGTALTVENLKNLTSQYIGISPNPVLNLLRTDGDVKILANPRIRVKSKEKAKIHIGDKLPVITSNVTSTGVTSESISYLDAGLKLEVEPLVRLDAEVEMKVGLEVSNVSGTVKTSTGTVAYQLGSRNANTVLRLKDGETQVLAGLISEAERSSANRVPYLSDLPLIGRLFSNNRDEAGKSEIVLLITPRIVRNVQRPELAEGEFFAGTENTVSDQPLRLRPAMRQSGPAAAAARAAGGAAAAEPPPGPQELPPEPDPVDLPPEPQGPEPPPAP